MGGGGGGLPIFILHSPYFESVPVAPCYSQRNASGGGGGGAHFAHHILFEHVA